ncbi:MAG: MFS transporter [Pseudoruegeria sp.]
MNGSSQFIRQNARWTVLSGPSLSIILASLGISTAAVTLPALSSDFSGQRLDPTLVVSIYVLAITALIVPIGRAGDIFGKRPVLISGVCLYILGAFLAFQALSLPMLVACRFIQGAGAAAMMAMPLASVRDFVPVDQVGRWMGVMGTMSAIGTASGPAIGGVIVAAFGWRAVYLMQFPVALAALALCLVYFHPPKRDRAQKGIDLFGSVTLAVFLAAVTFLVSDISNGFDFNMVLFAILAVGAIVAFCVIEARTETPIIPIEVLRSNHVRLSLAMNAIVSLVMMGVLVVGPFFLVGGLGLTTAQMGLVMSVGPISAVLSGISAGRLTDKIGSGRAVVFGASAMVVATAAMAGLPYVFKLYGFILAFILLAPSYQVFLAALNTSVMENASEQDRGVTSGVLNLSRNFGFVLGAGTVSAVFWSMVRFETNIEDGAQMIRLAMAGTFAVCCVLTLSVVLLSINAYRSR